MNESLQWSCAGLARVALACLLVGSCAPDVGEPVGQQEIERAREALQPFKEQLQDSLVGALEEGPEKAIEVCRAKAPEIAERVSNGGIRMGRTSHRLRNQNNAPEPWVEPILAEYLDDPEAAARAVRIDEATIGYVEPIRMRHFCLKCHGPAVEPDLLTRIRELYPEDRAVDFRVGDLRGVFWVTIPAGADVPGSA